MVAGDGGEMTGGAGGSVGRGRESVTAAKEMVASIARRQQRETAAAGKVVARSGQSAAGGGEAAATGTMTRRVLVAGTAVTGKLHMAWRVLVAEAVEVHVVADDGGNDGSGSPEEIRKRWWRQQ